MRAIAIFSPSRRSGKSWLTAALGRSLARSGWLVAPFQSQTEVSHQAYGVNSLAEISHSAAWQAWASNIPPSTLINPVLLKGDRPAHRAPNQFQLQIRGRGIGTVSRTDYYNNYYDITRPLIRECVEQLQQSYDVLLFDSYRHSLHHPIDADTDDSFTLLKNLGLPTSGILLIDCTHEGELSQLWGLWQRLSPENQQLIQGIVFNQWQGDHLIAEQHRQWVQTKIQRPVLGYLPPLDNLAFSPESPLTFPALNDPQSQNQLRIQVLKLPHFEDYPEFDPLRSEPSLQLSFVDPTEPLGYPDAVIIPTTTEAIADLEYLHKQNYPQQLQEYLRAGGTVLGLGNGATLCNQQISPTDTSESLRGLAVMPFTSRLSSTEAEQLSPQETMAIFPWRNLMVQGRALPWELLNYDGKRGYRQLFDDPNLGIVNQNQTIWAVYLQSLFNNGPWRRLWLNALRQKRGLASLPTGIADFQECRELILETLANHLEEHLDLGPIVEFLK
jgi:adenosylcobyric acid synthase